MKPRPFPHESDLRDHIAHNLEKLEPGLKLCRRCPGSVEFSFQKEDGRIDVLATDAQEGLLIIECKRDTAGPDALGQLLGYLAWFMELFQLFQFQIRGAIVARKASHRLLRALTLVPHLPIMVFEIDDASTIRRIV